MAEPRLTDEQKRVVRHGGSNLLVSAAAGSGKTFVLVSRLMRYICEENRDIDDFLIITYTRAAAAELRAKILKEINARLSREPNRHLMRQQTRVFRAQINTIHAFCQSILRENAQLLDISPDFRIADESEIQVLQQDVVERVLRDRYDNAENNTAFRALADTMGAGLDDRALIEIVKQTRAALQSHPYPDIWLDDCAAMWDTQGVSDAGETVWGKYLLTTAGRMADYWAGQMTRTLDEINADRAMAKAYAPSFEKTRDALRAFSRSTGRGWDAAALCSGIPFDRLGSLTKYDDKEKAERVKSVRERCKGAVEKLRSFFCGDTASVLEDITAMQSVMKELFSLVKDFDAAFSEEKKKRNILDFSDLEHKALALLTDRETGGAASAALNIRKRFKEIMVDEYQDVNRVQDMIFSAVSDGRNLFMVGDVKQSIYRFRLADPTIFLEKYRNYAETDGESSEVPRKLLLSENFRSRQGIVDAVNFVFENIMSEDFGGMDYTEREALHYGAKYGESEEPETELLILDASDAEDESAAQLEARLAAKRVSELLCSGMTVRDGDGERALRCSDIMLLLRSLKNSSELYARAFEELGIPVQTDRREDFFDAPEITAMLSLLHVIDNPHQDIALISALRSPLFGFTPDELAYIRCADRDSDFYGAMVRYAETDDHSRAFLNRLYNYRLISSDYTAQQLIWKLFVDTGALTIFGAMPGGELRQANLMQLYDYAGSAARTGRVGLFSFLSGIDRLREQKKQPEIAPPSGGADAVTITSIHRSKGLEAPVVLLCGSTKKFNTEDSKKPLLIHPGFGAGPMRTDLERRIKYATLPRMSIAAKISEETLAEEMRLLYVAMTRAREKLIITCSYKDLKGRLQKLGRHASLPPEPQALRDCQCMADWILIPALCREEAQPLRDFAGLSLPARSYPDRWLIKIIRAEELAAAAVPEAREAEDDTADEEAVREIAERLAFSYPYEKAPSIPSKVTATELKSAVSKETEAAENAQPLSRTEALHRTFRVPDFETDRALTPAERGTAAHLAMQYIDYGRCTTEMGVRAELGRMTRLRLITQKQADSVSISRILRLFSSPLGRRILEADGIMREFKFSVMRNASDYFPDGGDEKILLQGVIDCCIEEDGELTVIDYKTDFVGDEGAAAHAERYRAQLQAYAGALEEITGKTVREQIVYFLRTGEEVKL